MTIEWSSHSGEGMLPAGHPACLSSLQRAPFVMPSLGCCAAALAVMGCYVCHVFVCPQCADVPLLSLAFSHRLHGGHHASSP